jgi:hypothetical protein
MDKIAVITAYFSSDPPDFLPPAPKFNVDCYLFSNLKVDAKGWKNVVINGLESNDIYSFRKLGKLPKIVSHIFLPNYEWYVWHDFNQEVSFDPVIVTSHLDKNGKVFAGFRHSLRQCVFQEAETVRYSRESADAVDKVKELLTECGVEKNSGLFELTAFYRKNTIRVNDAFCHWMYLINHVSSRDQLTFPLIVKKYGLYNIQLLAGTAQKHVGGGNLFFNQHNNPLVLANRNWR